MELVRQDAQAVRLLDRVQVLALEVLDQAQQEALGLLRLFADKRGHSIQARQSRSTPAPLSCQ